MREIERTIQRERQRARETERLDVESSFSVCKAINLPLGGTCFRDGGGRH